MTSPAYHPRTERNRARRRGKLGMREASAMAIGGMIGGGIFSVLGVTVDLTGHLAFASFLIGGLLAGLTARALARLAARSKRSGGPFAYLRDEGHTAVAAWVAWLLIVGYVFALAVYAFTFGHYFANVLGAPVIVARLASLGVLGAFVAINLRGVAASGLTEDTVVAIKLVVLAVIALIGLASFEPSRLEPLNNHGTFSLLLGAAVIFVAYEGFELLPYDYAEIEDPERTLPRALYLSVGVVTLVYVLVTLGSQMLVSDATIVADKEVAFALAGQKALGTAGLWAATGGALLATSSAINATLFSTARLMRDVSTAGELPERLGRERGGLPLDALIWLSIFGAGFSLLPGITEIVSFGSLTFLLVFALINFMHARHTAAPGLDRALAYFGAAGCAAAAVGLVYYLGRSDRPALALVLVCAAVLVIARLSFVRSKHTGDHGGAAA